MKVIHETIEGDATLREDTAFHGTINAGESIIHPKAIVRDGVN